MEQVDSFISAVSSFVWGPPMLGMLGVTGVLLTLGSGVHALAAGGVRLQTAL